MKFKPVCDSCRFFKNGVCENHPEGYPTERQMLDKGGICVDFKLRDDIVETEAQPKDVTKDKWQCVYCGEEFEVVAGRKPLNCHNPNCNNKKYFKALTGPWKYFDGKVFIPGRMGREILKELHFVTMEETDDIYVYDDGIYVPRGEVVVKEIAQRRLGDELAKTHRIFEVVNFVRRETYKSSREFGGSPHLLPIENGLLDVKTRKLKEHTPDEIFLTKLPVKFDPEADCPKIKKFLRDVTTKDFIPIIQEAIGHCFWKEYWLAKAVMLHGDGENGKSTLLNLIEKLLGAENIANVSLQHLIYDKFSWIDLLGKLANIHADIPTSALSQTGAFKTLTGRDTIYGEKKHVQAKVPFKNHATMFYSTNRLPKTNDTSHAFFRRWIIIDLPYRFTDNPNDKHKNKDPHILEKIATPEELSGFLNWALNGLHRLFKNGKFSVTKGAEEIKDMWIAESDSLNYFAQKIVEVDFDTYTLKDDFYDAYREFCSENGLDIVKKRSVTEEIPTIIPETYLFRPRSGNPRRPQAWANISIGKWSKRSRNIKQPNLKNKNKNQKTLESSKTKDHFDQSGKVEPLGDLSQHEKIEKVLEIIRELEEDYGGAAPIKEVERIAASEGISAEFVRNMFAKGKNRGYPYEPKQGMIKRAV